MNRINLFLALLLSACFCSCSGGFGEKLTYGKGELFYTKSVTKEMAEKTGSFLEKSGYFNNSKEVSVQVDKPDSVYRLRLVVSKQYQETDSSLDLSYKVLCTLASVQVFDNAPVEVDLCNEYFETKRTLK